MTGSATKQPGLHPRKRSGLLRYARNDEDMVPHSRGALCVRAMHILVAPSKEGAGNAGCTPHPLPCVQNKKTHAGQHRYAEITPALPAQWLYGLLRALPGVRAL